MVEATTIAVPTPGSGLPSDLIDLLIRLIQGSGDGWGPPDIWPQVIPPEWRRWLSPDDEIERRLERAARELVRETAQAAYARARMQALDLLVGGPCLSAAAIFDAAGHVDAALLLREFVTAKGPPVRSFVAGSAFSVGFSHSETTTRIIAHGLAQWKARPGGLQANNGTFTNAAGTFVPLAADMRLYPMPGPSVRIIGSPEAHVIGSFAYDGRLVSGNVAEWRATNVLSLKSYFAENWTRRVNISLVDNNQRPDRYGNTTQVIYWRTTTDGTVLDRP